MFRKILGKTLSLKTCAYWLTQKLFYNNRLIYIFMQTQKDANKNVLLSCNVINPSFLPKQGLKLSTMSKYAFHILSLLIWQWQITTCSTPTWKRRKETSVNREWTMSTSLLTRRETVICKIINYISCIVLRLN